LQAIFLIPLELTTSPPNKTVWIQSQSILIVHRIYIFNPLNGSRASIEPWNRENIM
jgi:hypothetical protein